MRENFFGDFWRNDLAESLDSGPLQIGDAAELAEQFLNGAGTHAGDIAESGFCLALSAPLAVKGHGKAMRFIADLLNEMKHWGMAVENAGLVFLAKNIENF